MQPPFWYHIALSVFKPLYHWRVAKRSNHPDDLKKELTQRFGPFLPAKNKNTIWFHAVSVGETNAAQPLIEHYLKQGQCVLVTNTTKTGQARAKQLFQEHYSDQFQAVFLPLDQQLLIEQFLNQYQPKILLLMETELWPNLLACVAEYKIPQLLLNARLSEKSANGYAKLKRLVKPMLLQLDWIATQDRAALLRFEQLGKPVTQMSVVGNIKFDISAPCGVQQQAIDIAQHWQLKSRKVIVLASTHADEEANILSALKAQLIADPTLVCIVVPRHPERFEEVFEVSQGLGLNTHRRSLKQSIDTNTQVYLADSMGELWLWYAIATVAYVGGSLNQTGGGHNILEPISLGVPTVLGERYFNFQTVVDDFLQHDAVKVVSDFDQAQKQIIELLENSEKTEQMVQRAFDTLKYHQGALNRHIEMIDRFLKV